MIEHFISELTLEFRDLISSDNGKNMIPYTVTAYNYYQTCERSEVDYLWDLRNNTQLAEAIKSGLTAEDIIKLCNRTLDVNKLECSYFFYGENHKSDLRLLSSEEVIQLMLGYAEEIVKILIRHPHACMELYYRLIGSKIKFED